MSSVDSIWADMQKESSLSKEKLDLVSKKKSSLNKKKGKSKKEKKEKKNVMDVLNLSVNECNASQVEIVPESTPSSNNDTTNDTTNILLNMSGEDLIARLQRPIQQTQDEKLSVRKVAMESIHNLVCVELKDRLPDATMTLLLDELSKPILRRFADNGADKIRELAIDIMTYLIARCRNLLGLLPYLYPVLMDRLGNQHGFDSETNIFVHDVEGHEAWKRGAAVARQDQAANGTDGVAIVRVIEPSEEIRLRLLKLVSGLVEEVVKRGTTNIIHPYFHDSILFIQAHLRDPFPEVKLQACDSLSILARQPSLNQGFVYYALALARASLPVLRHRHAKVRCAAVRLVAASIAVPYKAKCRGAGTEAVVDLIGYTAQDTIPIAAFYGGHTTVNYLAELTIDRVTSVRLETAKMLAEFITSLPDRYDHRTRLVPFLLNAVNDEDSQVCEVAMTALSIAGAEYERENEKDIIERRQYGVDGDRRALHEGVLPHPFKERPRLGERLYVRGCTRRFMKPLLNELTDWKSKTKLSSARLLRTVIVYSEEALTQDINVLVPELCTAFKSLDSGESEVFSVLSECCELLGRFIAPDSYVPFLLPRLRGELAVLPTGIDASGRALVLLLGKLFIRGSSPKELVKHAEQLAEALTDDVILTSSLHDLKSRALEACGSLVKALAQSGSSLEAHYLATGRLAHKTRLIESLIYGLLIWRSDPALSCEADDIFVQLASVEARDDAAVTLKVQQLNQIRKKEPQNKEHQELVSWLVTWLVEKYVNAIAARACEAYSLDALWEPNDSSHIVLTQVMSLLTDTRALASLLAKMHELFEGVDEKEVADGMFEQWSETLGLCCQRLCDDPGCCDESEGRLEHFFLCLLDQVCRQKASVDDNNHSRFHSITCFIALASEKKWSSLRHPQGIVFASSLIAYLSPSASIPMRAKACECISRLLRIGTKGRLKSFGKMEKSNAVRREWKAIACLVYTPLLSMLDDAADVVRVGAARALEDILFFVSPQGKYVSGSIEERGSIEEEWVSLEANNPEEEANQQEYISLSDFTRKVLPYLKQASTSWDVEEVEDPFLDTVDSLLQQAAVIDPCMFQSVLAQFEDLSGRLGDLECHVELLVSLEGHSSARNQGSRVQESLSEVNQKSTSDSKPLRFDLDLD